MDDTTGAILGITIVILLVIAGYSESRNRTWRRLTREFGWNGSFAYSESDHQGWAYWFVDGEEKGFSNGMRVKLVTDGIVLRPITFPIPTRAIFLPWSRLTCDGNVSNAGLWRYIILGISDTNVEIRISPKLQAMAGWKLRS